MAIDLWQRPLPEGAQKDIELLIDRVDSLIPILREYSDKQPAVSPWPMYGYIAERLSIDVPQVARMFLALENIIDVREGTKEASDILSLLESRVSKARAANLAANSAAFAELLTIYGSDHPLHISIKSEKLSYLHETLYQDGEIITDVRPVFDGTGDAIKEMVITHTLVLALWDSKGSRRSHFAMDAQDVLRLKEACERAIRKANTVRIALEGKAWAVTVLNDDDVV